MLLFGSAVTGRLGPDSDIDLAVLLGHDPPDAFELAGLRVELEASLGRSFDLVILDTVSPILALEILRHHRVLAHRRPAQLQGFVVRTLGAYFDLKRVRRPIEEALLRQAGPHE